MSSKKLFTVIVLFTIVSTIAACGAPATPPPAPTQAPVAAPTQPPAPAADSSRLHPRQATRANRHTQAGDLCLLQQRRRGAVGPRRL